jgi:DNA-binding winged helix-turn-helix (wHTH) protein
MSHLRFGSFTLDVHNRLLLRQSEPIALGPKVVETLIALAENAGVLVTKSDLMERLWPKQFVQEANLTQSIYRLRKELARGGLSNAIETMPCRGYRFVAPVEICADAAQAPVSMIEVALPRHARWFAALATMLFLIVPFLRPSTGAFALLSPESRRLYLLGRYHWNLRSDRSQIKESFGYFRRVTRRDPSNPLGYAGLADSYIAVVDNDCGWQLAQCRGAAGLAIANAKRAVELGPYSAEAHTSYAMTLATLSRNYTRSDIEFEWALQLDDHYALAHYWYGNSLLVRGRLAAAAIQYQRAIELEPTSPGAYAWFAEDKYLSGQYQLAVEYARESLAIAPRWRLSWIVLGLAHERLGEPSAAVAAFEHLPDGMRNALARELYTRSDDARQARVHRPNVKRFHLLRA